METTIDFVEDLDNFIQSCEEKWKSLANAYGVCEDSLMSNEETGSELVTCSIDPNHEVRNQFAFSHEDRCRLQKQQDYSRAEVRRLLPSSSWFYEASACSLETFKLDRQLCEQILKTAKPSLSDGLPLTHNRYTTEFSSHERLLIYDFFARKAKEQCRQPAISAAQTSTSSGVDLIGEIAKQAALDKKAKMSLMTDRKPKSYRRAKRVYSQKKTYTELLREVLAAQMELIRPAVAVDSYHEDSIGRSSASPDRHGAHQRQRPSSSNTQKSHKR